LNWKAGVRVATARATGPRPATPTRLLEQKYGLDKMQQAEKIISGKAPDNPKRCVGYFIGVVMGLK
jgi:hypothetical protein